MKKNACRICGADVTPYGKATVLRKYEVQYFECSACGFVQTEEPYWLAEAYSEAIARTDIGLVNRNLFNARVASSVINWFVDGGARFLDYGGGYGLFTRLMRDRGYDFHWQDKYARNLFAQGFEDAVTDTSRFEMITVFELVEHLADPVAELQKLCASTDHLLISTLLVPESRPKPGEWWDFALEHGQHIGLFTRQSLHALAERLGRKLCSNGKSIHYIGTRNICPASFRLAVSGPGRWLADVACRRSTLLLKDAGGDAADIR